MRMAKRLILQLCIFLIILLNTNVLRAQVYTRDSHLPSIINQVISDTHNQPLKLYSKAKTVNGLTYDQVQNQTFNMPSYFFNNSAARADLEVYYDRSGVGPTVRLHYLPIAKIYDHYWKDGGGLAADYRRRKEIYLSFGHSLGDNGNINYNGYTTFIPSAQVGLTKVKMYYKYTLTQRTRRTGDASTHPGFESPSTAYLDFRNDSGPVEAEVFNLKPIEAKWININESLLSLSLCNEGQSINLYDYFTDKTGVIFSLDGVDITNGILNIATVGKGEYKLKASKSYANGLFTEEIDLNVIDLPSASITGSANNICEGTSTTITVAQAPQGLTYVYKWYRNNSLINSQNSNIISVNESGSYHAEIFAEGTSCKTITNSYSVNVNEAPKPNINLQGNNLICEGESVVLIPSTNGVSYTWLNEKGEDVGDVQVLTVNKAGSYKVIVGYENGCSNESAPVTITVRPNPKPTITASGVLEFCEGESVTLFASLPDGFIAQSYRWSNEQTGQSITVTKSGTYFVTASNSQGCTNISEPITVIVHPNPKPTITANGALEFCDGGSVILTAPSSSSYLWNNGEITQSITVSTSGAYSVKTFTLQGCFNESDIVSVKVNPNVEPLIEAQGPTNVCEGESVVLQVTNAQPNTTYTWSNGTTGLQTTVSTSQSVYVIASNQSGCFKNSDPIIVSVQPIQKPIISTSGITQFCEGGSVTLTVVNVAGADEIRWSNGEVGNSITVSTSGNYYAVLKRGNCERSSEEVKVLVTPNVKPIIQAQGLTDFCEGEKVVLQISNPQPNTSYTWNNGVQGQSITVNQSGQYFVTATNQSGCSRTGDAITINVQPIQQPIISLSSLPEFCEGGSVTLTVVNTYGADEIRWSNGEVGNSITVSTTGNYYAVLKRGNCERSSEEVFIKVTPNIKPLVEYVGSSTICEGESVVLQITNPQLNVSYTWSNGEVGTSIIVNKSGNYFVTSQNSNQCSRTSDNIPITVLPIAKPTVSIDNELAICEGDSIVMTINETAKSYRWSNGETTKSITVKNSGSYVAYLSNGECERASDPLNVTVHPNSNVVVSQLGSLEFCEGDSLLLTVVNEGKYLWNTGSTNRTLTIKESGIYTVKVTNKFNCVNSSEVFKVTVSPLPKPTIQLSSQPTICEGESIVLTINETAKSYRWSNGETTKSITVKNSGSYVAYLSNGECERASEPTTITVLPNPIPQINYMGKTVFCEPDSVILYVTPIAGIKYTWSNGVVGNSITVKKTGNYFVTSTTQNSCVAISNTINVIAHPLPKPTIHLSGKNTFCEGDSVILTINEIAKSYRWSNGETTKSITVKRGGSYTAYIKNDFDCERASDPIVINVQDNPKPTINAINFTACEGSSVKLTASNGVSYLWSNGETTREIDVFAPGQYYVTVTNTLGCSNTSDLVTVKIISNPMPTITSSNGNNICEGESTTLTASDGNFYRWSNGETTKSIIVNKTDTYSVTITNENGCSRTSNGFNVIVNKPLALKQIPDQQICGNGQKLNLDQINTNPLGGTYEGEGVTFNMFDPLQVSTGIYNIKYTYITEFGCISTTDFKIEVAKVEILEPGSDLDICLTAGDILLQVEGLPVGVQFEGKGVVGNIFKPEQAGVGVHKISYKYTNSFGCTSSANRIITVTPIPTVPTVTGNVQVCVNTTISLEAKSSVLNNTNIIYKWYKEGAIEPFAIGSQIRYIVTKNEKIYVEAFSNKGCGSEKREVFISTFTPEIRLVANTNAISQGSSVQFKLEDLPGSNPSVRWEYDFGDGFKSNLREPLHYYNKPGIYTVSVRVYSEQGCFVQIIETDYIVVSENPIVVVPPITGDKPIEDNNPFYKTIIYPNPIKIGDQVTLKTYNSNSSNAKATLQVYTISGTPILYQILDLAVGQNEIIIDNIERMTANTYYMFVITFDDGRKESIKALVL